MVMKTTSMSWMGAAVGFLLSALVMLVVRPLRPDSSQAHEREDREREELYSETTAELRDEIERLTQELAQTREEQQAEASAEEQRSEAVDLAREAELESTVAWLQGLDVDRFETLTVDQLEVMRALDLSGLPLTHAAPMPG